MWWGGGGRQQGGKCSLPKALKILHNYHYPFTILNNTIHFENENLFFNSVIHLIPNTTSIRIEFYVFTTYL